MCGIAGAFARPGFDFSAVEIETMAAVLGHRGPDGSGCACWTPERGGAVTAGVAHTRLAILDLSTKADQPMSASGDAVTMVYNGEVYNYVELRHELRGLGHEFSSTGDTEVVLKAYLQWGRDAVKRFRGMFAIIVVDHRDRTVFASRDPFGIKPLYVAQTARGLVLASEIKAVLSLEDADRALDPDLLLRFVRFGRAQHLDRTLYAGIDALGAGESLVFSLDDPTPVRHRYFSWEAQPLGVADLSFADAAAEVRRLFMESVRLHLRSDVTVGTALSGGIDSSSVVCAMREIVGAAGDIHAFTFTAPGTPLDEERWARIAADHAGATLHTLAPGGRSLVDELDELAARWDEPMGGTSVYAQYCVFREARLHGIKVMLDGQGADELMAGYDRYFSARVAGLLRRRRLVAAARLVRSGAQVGRSPRRVAGEVGDFLLPSRLNDVARRVARRPIVPSYVDAGWFDERGARLGSVHATARCDVLHSELVRDTTEHSLPHLLRFEDTNSMLNSIESRVPFLDPRLASFVLSLPENYLMSDATTGKAVFRTAMEGITPAAILQRTDKLGFAPPKSIWMRDVPADRRLALARDVRETLPFLRADSFDDIWSRADRVDAAAESAWRLVFLSAWARTHDVSF